MYDLAHACLCCRTITIFAESAPFPRHCGLCDGVLREAPSSSSFVARPAFLDDDAFTLELGPSMIQAAPF